MLSARYCGVDVWRGKGSLRRGGDSVVVEFGLKMSRGRGFMIG